MLEQAVILCAGRGSRLGSLTDSVPKAMLPISAPTVNAAGTEPLLNSTIRKLKSIGFREIVLVVGYRAESITEFFRETEGIRFAHQDKATGTAAALEATLGLLKKQFLLTYGDLIINEADYSAIKAAGICDGGNWVALDRRERPIGAAYLENERITRIIEKPESSSTPWNTSGLFVLAREIAALTRQITASPRGERELAQMLQLAIDQGQVLKPYFLAKKSIDIGTPDCYRRATARSSAKVFLM